MFFDTYALTEKNVKQFVIKRLNHAEDSTNEFFKKAMLNQAYGAIQFATNYCFPAYNFNLSDWWEKEAKPKFEKLF